MNGDRVTPGRNRVERQGLTCRAFFRMAVLVLVACLGFVRATYAELKPMNADEMKTATAQAGFTDFSLNNSTARLFLDIHIETYATIEKFTAGNYDRFTPTGDPIIGSDQAWNTIKLGQDDENLLSIDGLVFIADFEEGSLDSGPNTNPNPKLERIVIGSNRLQGQISAMITNFTGIYSSALTGGGSPDTIRATRGDLSNGGVDRTTFNFDSTSVNRGLFLVLNVDSGNPGVQIVAGFNENNIPAVSLGVPWWDSP